LVGIARARAALVTEVVIIIVFVVSVVVAS
jgi:hypothetical protein